MRTQGNATMVRTPPTNRQPISPAQPAVDPVSVEGHLRNLEDQLAQLRAQVRQAQQLSSLGTAAAMIAHEVNNLLTPIVSYAQFALQDDDPKLKEKALQVTVKNARMLVAMSERVLEIGAAQRSAPALVSLHDIVVEAAASQCRDLGKDGITLRNQIDPTCNVFADPLQLQQVFFNLLLNARHAMKGSHSGSVTISATQQAGSMVIDVRDTGPGIAPKMLGQVFEPLQTSKPIGTKSDNRRARCAGLGLALCRDLIEENGGSISVSSQVHQGTTFTIQLPCEAPQN